MSSLDRGGRSDYRQRRALQRLASNPSNAIGNTPIGASSGLVYNGGSLNIKLITNSGLALSASGLGIDLGPTPALVLDASGISILLDTDPGLQTTTGLKILLNGTSLTLGASGLSVTAPEGRWSVTAVKLTAYTAVIGELVRCDPSGGIFTVTLPTAVGMAGRQITVKNVTGSTNVITVDTTSGETIDLSATASLSTAFQSKTFVSDGTNWMTV